MSYIKHLALQQQHTLRRLDLAREHQSWLIDTQSQALRRDLLSSHLCVADVSALHHTAAACPPCGHRAAPSACKYPVIPYLCLLSYVLPSAALSVLVTEAHSKLAQAASATSPVCQISSLTYSTLCNVLSKCIPLT